MADSHPTDDQLAAHLETSDPRIDEHVDRCDGCRERLAHERELAELLAEREVWDGALSLALELPVPMEQRRSYDRMRAARETAADLLAPALRSIDVFREAGIERDRRFHSAEAVHLLTKAAKALRDRETQFALSIAAAATSIADKLTHDAISRVAVGTAWLERAAICVALARHRDAEAALTRAERAYEQGDSTEWDLANVWLTRANVYVETDRLDEAAELAAMAAEGYRLCGDRTRYLRALLVKGSVFYTCGAFRDGIAVYEVILAMLDRDADEATYANAQHNAAYCHLEIGDVDTAERLFVESLATWDALGQDGHRARAAWGLASVAVARGQLLAALDALDDARRQLGALGMMNDEALARLDMADVLLALGRPSEARVLVGNIAVQFATEGMMRNARIALAHLSDALRREQPAIDVLRREVRYVREYLAQLPVFSTRPFDPSS